MDCLMALTTNTERKSSRTQLNQLFTSGPGSDMDINDSTLFKIVNDKIHKELEEEGHIRT